MNKWIFGIGLASGLATSSYLLRPKAQFMDGDIVVFKENLWTVSGARWDLVKRVWMYRLERYDGDVLFEIETREEDLVLSLVTMGSQNGKIGI